MQKLCCLHLINLGSMFVIICHIKTCSGEFPTICLYPGYPLARWNFKREVQTGILSSGSIVASYYENRISSCSIGQFAWAQTTSFLPLTFSVIFSVSLTLFPHISSSRDLSTQPPVWISKCFYPYEEQLQEEVAATWSWWRLKICKTTTLGYFRHHSQKRQFETQAY